MNRNTGYYYRVSAINDAGTGAPSNVAGAVTKFLQIISVTTPVESNLSLDVGDTVKFMLKSEVGRFCDLQYGFFTISDEAGNTVFDFKKKIIQQGCFENNELREYDWTPKESGTYMINVSKFGLEITKRITIK